MKKERPQILIVGGSGRLGFHMTLHFLDRNYQVFSQCWAHCNNLLELKKVYKELEVLKFNFLESGAASFLRTLKKMNVSLSGAILIHPVFHQRTFQNLSKEAEEDIKRTLDINLAEPLALLIGLEDVMREKGTIVFLTDLLPLRGIDVYEPLKPSLVQLAASSAIHSVIHEAPKLFKKPIKLFGIALGWIDVKGLGDDLKEKARLKIPLRTLGKPSELADLIEYLIERAPSYMSGTLIRFSGGL